MDLPQSLERQESEGRPRHVNKEPRKRSEKRRAARVNQLPASCKFAARLINVSRAALFIPFATSHYFSDLHSVAITPYIHGKFGYIPVRRCRKPASHSTARSGRHGQEDTKKVPGSKISPGPVASFIQSVRWSSRCSTQRLSDPAFRFPCPSRASRRATAPPFHRRPQP